MRRYRRSAPQGNEVNLRRAAALALVGWYLMVPPLTEDGHPAQMSGPIRRDSAWGVEVNTPFSKWELIGTYDSAGPMQTKNERP
jgi:hypothetical protein